MEIAPPEVYVSPQPVRNAFAISDRNGGAVCVFQGTLDALSDDELAAVLAHEVGHIKNRDSLYVALFQSLRVSLTVVLVFIAIVCALAISLLTRGRGGALAGVFGAGMLIVGAAASYLMVTAGLRSREIWRRSIGGSHAPGSDGTRKGAESPARGRPSMASRRRAGHRRRTLHRRRHSPHPSFPSLSRVIRARNAASLGSRSFSVRHGSRSWSARTRMLDRQRRSQRGNARWTLPLCEPSRSVGHRAIHPAR